MTISRCANELCKGCIHEETPVSMEPCNKCMRRFPDNFVQRRISNREIINALKMMNYETTSNRLIVEDVVMELELREAEEDEGED